MGGATISEVDLVNGALLHIGNPTINSLNDNTAAARAAKVLYPGARDALLRRHPWNFAKRRATLSEVQPPPISGFYHRYALPADFMYLVRTDDRLSKWSVEGNFLLTSTGHIQNQQSVNILYVSYVTDPNQFDGVFRECLEHWLASKLAVALRNDATLSNSLEAEYKELLREARVQNAHENPMGEIFDDELVRARRNNIWNQTTPVDANSQAW
jgi:hypothetical protein